MPSGKNHKGTKWRLEDGAPPPGVFEQAGREKVEKALSRDLQASQLPAAIATFERFGQRLWDCRAGRLKSATVDELNASIADLQLTLETCRERGWDDKVTVLEQDLKPLQEERARARLYEGQRDKDREQFYDDCLHALQELGIDHVPIAFAAITEWVLGKEAPKPRAIPDIRKRSSKRLRAYAALTAIGSLRADAHVLKP